MHPLSQVWIFASIAMSFVLLVGALLRGRKLRSRISELETKLEEEMNKTAELELAIEEHYIPAWHDAIQRLAGPPICTCPPHPYKSSCPRHSPEKRKQQLRRLEEVAARLPIRKQAVPASLVSKISETEEMAAGVSESSA